MAKSMEEFMETNVEDLRRACAALYNEKELGVRTGTKEVTRAYMAVEAVARGLEDCIGVLVLAHEKDMEAAAGAAVLQRRGVEA